MMRAFLSKAAGFTLSGLSLMSSVHASNEIAPSADQVRPLLVGQSIPSVQVRSLDGNKVDLNKAALKQPTVILFYRGGWCPFCNTQLKELKDIESELVKLGYQILAVSADRVEELSKTLEKHKLSYLLFSDSSMDAAKAFGLAFKVDDATLAKHKEFRIDLEKASGETHHILPVPAVFLVGTDGEIKFQYVNPNYKVRLSGEILLTAAKVYSGKAHEKKP